MASKVRRVDFSPDEWLAGTASLSNAERGLYITACAMIYSHGGPITIDELKARCQDHGNAFNRQLLRLLTLGKLSRNGSDLANKRCENELEKAGKRAEKGREMADQRWNNKGLGGDKALQPSNGNHQPSTKNHQLEEDSEADASGAEAPDPDPVKDLWDRGVRILGASSRSLIGKARKQYGDLATIRAIAACEIEGPTNPVSFFAKCLQQGDRNERKQQSGYDILARAAIEYDERQSHRGSPEAAYRPAREAEELDDGGDIVH